ncbi:hypothetical protein [Marinicellulosiphila megalodicopiae]|uniref:hypothetical protein n=1 Tax=Marinicellulosiphila megalodicopiae TaxID=2724896 RepID=UPI003BAE34BA
MFYRVFIVLFLSLLLLSCKSEPEIVNAHKDNIRVYDVSVKKRNATKQSDVKIIFKIENLSSQTINFIRFTLYFKNNEGRVIYEKDFNPLVDFFSAKAIPIKPGYIHLVNDPGIVLHNIPSEWSGSYSLEIKEFRVTDLP